VNTNNVYSLLLSCFKYIYVVTKQNNTKQNSYNNDLFFFSLNLTIKMTFIGLAQHIIKVYISTTLVSRKSGVSKFFLRGILCSARLHLFDQKYYL